jgi:acetylglutamate kinase
MADLHIVKVGGHVLENSAQREQFLRAFAALDGAKILVHGGGAAASMWSRKLGIEPRFIDGRRITDEHTLELTTMIYGGSINRTTVARLHQLGCTAIGLAGADANVLTAVRKEPVKGIDFGFVGTVTSVNTNAVRTLLQAGWTPVFSAITHDGSGQLLNTNADAVAAAISKAFATELSKVALVLCFEGDGVRARADDPTSTLESLDYSLATSLVTSNQITGGMRAKLDEGFQAAATGVEVRIGSADQLLALLNGTSGTQLLAG